MVEFGLVLPLSRRLGDGHARGQSFIEFAAVLPIMILLLVGIVDFGRALDARMTVINAAREGARFGVTHAGDDAWGPYSCPQIQANVPPEIMRMHSDMFTGGNTSISVSGTGTCAAGDELTVTVHYTYDPLFPFWFGSGIGMSTTVQMNIE